MLTETQKYLRTLRSADKRAYAAAYVAWLKNPNASDPPGRGALSYMAAQAVRMRLDSARTSDALYSRLTQWP